MFSTLNEKQKKVVLICTVLILLMAVFPPTMTPGGSMEGYQFVFTIDAPIDFSRLMMRWVTVILVGYGLVRYRKED